MITKEPVVFAAFQKLPDPRAEGGNKQHELYEMVVVALCATICGAESWTDVERFGREKLSRFKRFVKLHNGIPSHDTIGRVFAADQHWTVEHRLHWTLDVTFSEDASRIRKGNGQEVMGNFRRLALSILKRDTSLKKQSIRGKRLIAGWNEQALEAIIAAA